MFKRNSATLAAFLLALTLIVYYAFGRYYKYPFNTSTMVDQNNVIKLLGIGGTSKDGAFYREADMARPTEDWEKKVCPLQELKDLNDFYEYIYTQRVQCDIQMMMGGRFSHTRPVIDGDKWICMDKKYNITIRDCLVYSFGVGYDFSFEDEVARKLGCKVFAFDPTMSKVDTHNRTERISFFKLGIGDFNNTGNDVKIKVNRYVNILSELGHLNATIDIEQNELPFFKDVLENTTNLLKNVKMLAMEVHTSNNITEISQSHKTFWKYFQLLDCFGFKIWHTSVNMLTRGQVVNGRHRTCCYEVVWVQDRNW